MISILIQNIIFAVLVVGLVFVLKILGKRFNGLVSILIGVLLLWFDSVLNFMLGVGAFSLLVLIVGVAVNLYGLISLSKELKVKGLSINSFESAIESIIKEAGAKTCWVFSASDVGRNLDCVYKVGDVINGSKMVSIPLEGKDKVIGYIVLCGDKKLNRFDEKKFETELGIIKFWMENWRLSERIKTVEKERESLKMEIKKVKNDLLKHIHFAAHELKKPLTGIIGFSEILRDEFKNLSENDVLEFVGNIKQAGKEMLETIECLREIFEIKLGEYKLNFEELNLADEINKVVGRIKKEMDEGDWEVVLNVSEDLEIEVDREKFAEIVYQLLSNVSKISRENSKVKISACRIGNWVELSVENEGFNQNTKLIPKPLGLGFEIIELLAKLHGSKVSVVSENNKVKFKVLFPLKREKGRNSYNDYKIEMFTG